MKINIQIVHAVGASEIRKERGEYVARWGYFYRVQAPTLEKASERIMSQFPDATIIDTGEKWTPFRGGESIARNSHVFVRFSLPETKNSKVKA